MLRQIRNLIGRCQGRFNVGHCSAVFSTLWQFRDLIFYGPIRAAMDHVTWRQRKWIIQIPGVECSSWTFNDCADAIGKHALNINSLEDQTARWYMFLFNFFTASQLQNYYTGQPSHLANMSLTWMKLAKNVNERFSLRSHVHWK